MTDALVTINEIAIWARDGSKLLVGAFMADRRERTAIARPLEVELRGAPDRFTGQPWELSR